MPRSILVPVRNFSADTHTIGPRAIPDNENGLYLEIARCTTAAPTTWSSSSVQLFVRVLASYDNGVTWISEGGMQVRGGIVVLAKTGEESQKNFMRVTWRPGTNRLMQATVAVTGGVLRTSFSVNTF